MRLTGVGASVRRRVRRVAGRGSLPSRGARCKVAGSGCIVCSVHYTADGGCGNKLDCVSSSSRFLRYAPCRGAEEAESVVHGQSNLVVQLRSKALPSTDSLVPVEVLRHRLPRRKVIGQKSSLTTGVHLVENAVDHVSLVILRLCKERLLDEVRRARPATTWRHSGR